MNVHFSGLYLRLDWDGYLTLKEAREWYKKGNGLPLYVDLEKIDLSGILSFLVPGAGQFYYGNDKQGWIDLSETIVTGVTMWGCQQYVANTKSESGAATAGLIYLSAGIWYVVNDICSVVNAIKGTRAVNRENGYAMIDVGNGVSVGCRPSFGYEVPEYACHMPGSLSTGMSFRIAF